jgi:hypothetical protein
LDVIIQGELEREPGGQTSLPDNNLDLVYVNDINSFMTKLIIIIFSFERNQINLDLLSNNANFLQISEICCIASVLNEFKMGHCSKKCISSSISNLHSIFCKFFKLSIWISCFRVLLGCNSTFEHPAYLNSGKK